MRTPLFRAICALWLVFPIAARAEQAPRPATDTRDGFILPNDNRHAAGALDGSILTTKLVAEEGDWQPEGPNGRTLSVQAFREETGQLTIPGPLIRVSAGTAIHASIRNNIPGTTLTVFGLGDRPATGANTPLRVSAGESREVRFLARETGTFHYWASTMSRPLLRRFDVDSQLGGAFVVDPADARADDRVFVIEVWRKPGTQQIDGNEIGTINGRSCSLHRSRVHRRLQRLRCGRPA